MVMKAPLTYLMLILASFGAAQENKPGGRLELGLRSTVSLFGDGGFVSTGVGGQFRLRFADRVNSEWFADYITADLGGYGKRTDAHIGWSVMAYPFNYQVDKCKMIPYLLVGHCFDYTQIERNSSDINNPKIHKRWSSAIQGGLGTHWYLTHNFNLSLAAQYMLHLGKNIEPSIIEDPITKGDYLYIEEGNLGLEGHLFLSLTANIYIADLWK
jgi:hypothetical protein